MTTRRQGTRQAALRRARDVKMVRDALRVQRERQVEQALADFFEFTAQAVTIGELARAKATKILADAETAAREPTALAAVAVRALAELGETRGDIGGLTGLQPTQVRDILSGRNGDGSGATPSAAVGPLGESGAHVA